MQYISFVEADTYLFNENIKASFKDPFSDDSKTQGDHQNQIHNILHNGEFIIYYQPQINVITGRISGIEALVRWQHPELGLLYPKEFIPSAEEDGSIVSIGEFILHKACTDIKELQKEGYTDLRVGVNISARQFQEPSFVDMVERVLNQTELDPHLLELEITENVFMYKTEYILKKMKDLKALGIRFSIDDFGTGYSSLSYLRDFPFDTLKIDQSFTQSLSNDHVNNFIVETIITLGRKLNLRIVAEGVETEQQLEFLKTQNVTEAQGYLYSKPVPLSELKELLEHYGMDFITKD